MAEYLVTYQRTVTADSPRLAALAFTQLLPHLVVDAVEVDVQRLSAGLEVGEPETIDTAEEPA